MATTSFSNYDDLSACAINGKAYFIKNFKEVNMNEVQLPVVDKNVYRVGYVRDCDGTPWKKARIFSIGEDGSCRTVVYGCLDEKE